MKALSVATFRFPKNMQPLLLDELLLMIELYLRVYINGISFPHQVGPHPMIAPSLFVFGLGYSAEIFVKKLQSKGWAIGGTSRRPERLDHLQRQGIDAHILSRNTIPGSTRLSLGRYTHILHSIPPDDAGDLVFDRFRDEILGNIEALSWFGYLSSTGVYGDYRGKPVDELSACHPTSVRSHRRYEAEQRWLDLHTTDGLPTHAFRLAGIYGPGRTHLTQLAARSLADGDSDKHLYNRIHVEDIAQVLEASAMHPSPGSIYNVADDVPATAQEVAGFAATLLGQAPASVPNRGEIKGSRKSSFQDQKIVQNFKIKKELGVELLFPDSKSGLSDLRKTSPSLKSVYGNDLLQLPAKGSLALLSHARRSSLEDN